jgi:hypothetical protein
MRPDQNGMPVKKREFLYLISNSEKPDLKKRVKLIHRKELTLANFRGMRHLMM